ADRYGCQSAENLPWVCSSIAAELAERFSHVGRSELLHYAAFGALALRPVVHWLVGMKLTGGIEVINHSHLLSAVTDCAREVPLPSGCAGLESRTPWRREMAGNPRENVKDKGFWDGGGAGHG